MDSHNKRLHDRQRQAPAAALRNTSFLSKLSSVIGRKESEPETSFVEAKSSFSQLQTQQDIEDSSHHVVFSSPPPLQIDASIRGTLMAELVLKTKSEPRGNEQFQNFARSKQQCLQGVPSTKPKGIQTSKPIPISDADLKAAFDELALNWSSLSPPADAEDVSALKTIEEDDMLDTLDDPMEILASHNDDDDRILEVFIGDDDQVNLQELPTKDSVEHTNNDHHVPRTEMVTLSLVNTVVDIDVSITSSPVDAVLQCDAQNLWLTGEAPSCAEITSADASVSASNDHSILCSNVTSAETVDLKRHTTFPTDIDEAANREQQTFPTDLEATPVSTMGITPDAVIPDEKYVEKGGERLSSSSETTDWASWTQRLLEREPELQYKAECFQLSVDVRRIKRQMADLQPRYDATVVVNPRRIVDRGRPLLIPAVKLRSFARERRTKQDDQHCSRFILSLFAFCCSSGMLMCYLNDLRNLDRKLDQLFITWTGMTLTVIRLEPFLSGAIFLGQQVCLFAFLIVRIFGVGARRREDEHHILVLL